MTATFEWNGATVTIVASTGRVAMRKIVLRQTVDVWEIEDAFRKNEMLHATIYLAHTQSVKGDLGFPVPNGEPTAKEIEVFCAGLMAASEKLMEAWDDAIGTANKVNDPALLPPEVVADEKKETPPSKRNDKSKETG